MTKPTAANAANIAEDIDLLLHALMSVETTCDDILANMENEYKVAGAAEGQDYVHAVKSCLKIFRPQLNVLAGTYTAFSQARQRNK